MKNPDWLKPGVYGAGIGAVAVAIFGFSWGGWVTASTAETLASGRAQQEVVAALLPICVAQSAADPENGARLSELRDTQSYRQAEFLMKTGWATMPGSGDPDQNLARACAEKLAAPS
jgi:pimeloyl-ACP methyl ester carboxylesterase